MLHTLLCPHVKLQMLYQDAVTNRMGTVLVV